MKKENIPRFIEKFEEHVSSTITDEQRVPRIDIDMELKFSDIDIKFYNIIQQFQPFGPENMAPVFVTRGVFDTGSGRVVGSSGEHLKLDLCCEDTGTSSLSAIAFGQGNKGNFIAGGQPIDIAYTVEMNDYKGNKNLQLNIKDIKISNRET
jgi:single-stranded-DNA-specific exonuclease